jgi:hypothetical protein
LRETFQSLSSKGNETPADVFSNVSAMFRKEKHLCKMF